MAKRKVLKIPNKIYLQIAPEGNDFEEMKRYGEITWCENRINDSDIVFYGYPRYKRLLARRKK